MQKVYGTVETYPSSVGWRVIYCGSRVQRASWNMQSSPTTGSALNWTSGSACYAGLAALYKEAHIIDALAAFSPTKTRVPDF